MNDSQLVLYKVYDMCADLKSKIATTAVHSLNWKLNKSFFLEATSIYEQKLHMNNDRHMVPIKIGTCGFYVDQNSNIACHNWTKINMWCYKWGKKIVMYFTGMRIMAFKSYLIKQSLDFNTVRIICTCKWLELFPFG